MEISTQKYIVPRFCLYVAAVGLVFQAIVLAVERVGWEPVMLEGGVIEIAQAGLVLCAAAGLAGLGYQMPGARGVNLLLACLAVFAFVREFNNEAIYHRILPWPGAKSIVGIGLLACVAWRYKTVLLRQTLDLLRRPAFPLYFLGFSLVVLWAQTLAQRPLFNARGDRTLEESLELAGYVLILCGVMEEYLSSAFNSGAASQDYGRLENTPPGEEESSLPHLRRSYDTPLRPHDSQETMR